MIGLLAAAILALQSDPASGAQGSPPAPPAKPAAEISVCLDPGHPSENGDGARGKSISELTAVWKIAQLAKPMLERRGVRVVMTKSKERQKVTNRERADIANKAKVDLMVRLHMDAAAETGFGTYFPAAKGTVRGVTGPSDEVIRLSRIAAQAFHPAAIKVIGKRLNDRGVKTDRQTYIGGRQGALTGSIFSTRPVLLLEMATLTNAADDRFVASKEGQEILAKAVAEGSLAAVRALRKR